MAEIEAIIVGEKGTPYDGGHFRVRLSLPSDFPTAPPRGTFLTKIYHPNVSRNGDICVETLKRDWQPTLGIRDVLVVIKCLLIHPNPESALNEEAGRQLIENYGEYAESARRFTQIHAIPDDVAAAGRRLYGPTTRQTGMVGHGEYQRLIIAPADIIIGQRWW
ncbi:ubiquitin-conjugating enzyme E2 S [Blastocladiella emersonii ATCC 22665]|nr:ubiquitin-conjugating enzyme E2 S [Blastocladiella emersonii ATCC 22665]